MHFRDVRHRFSLCGVHVYRHDADWLSDLPPHCVSTRDAVLRPSVITGIGTQLCPRAAGAGDGIAIELAGVGVEQSPRLWGLGSVSCVTSLSRARTDCHESAVHVPPTRMVIGNITSAQLPTALTYNLQSVMSVSLFIFTPNF